MTDTLPNEIIEMIFLEFTDVTQGTAARLVCRSWNEMYFTTPIIFRSYRISKQKSRAGMISNMKVAETFKPREIKGNRSTAILHLTFSTPAVNSKKQADKNSKQMSVEDYINLEKTSPSNRLRTLALILKHMKHQKSIDITFAQRWEWYYSFTINEETFVARITEAHIDYDSWGCEDYYSQNSYNRVMRT
mmetsp:Transcript_27018/g.30132  ORF Transcript_27018/g.30132 Transcript_27018/m.30132 type:complete len:190 (-) Transcript_27018:120-689(-)